MDFCAQKLKGHGLKSTAQRQAIIDFFEDQNRTLTPEDVWAPLKKKFGHLGLPSVYRNLEALVACGILARVHRFDNNRHYVLCHAHGQGHHHHIICKACGRVGEFDGCDIIKRKTVNGFKITGHFLQLEGICGDCRGQEGS